MLKIYLNKVKEDWIIDRLRRDWYFDNKEISTKFKISSNIIWLCAPWVWKTVPKYYLKNKKVLCSIYHIDDTKFGNKELEDFQARDKFVHSYHVISKKTYEQVTKITDKTIYTIPFWIDENIWFKINEKSTLKDKYNLPKNKFLIGSFQRDSEGYNTNLPKLSKGPDQFIEIVKNFSQINDVHIVLTGKRRNFVLNSLEALNISYTYLEMVSSSNLNELYNCLDLYIVSSRVEGGPQAILECSLSKTPIISTDVGIASEILHKKSIFDMSSFMNAQPNIEFAYRNAQKFIKPYGYQDFLKMFNEIYEN